MISSGWSWNLLSIFNMVKPKGIICHVNLQELFLQSSFWWSPDGLAWKSCQAITWWCHEMETFSALLAICAGNSPVPVEFPTQRPVTRSFDVFYDLRLNKRLSKQSWGWWFETPSRPKWRHRNDWMHFTLCMVHFRYLHGLTTCKLNSMPRAYLI